MEKYCKDCIYSRGDEDYCKCYHPKIVQPMGNTSYCNTIRLHHHECGKDAKLFTPIDKSKDCRKCIHSKEAEHGYRTYLACTRHRDDLDKPKEANKVKRDECVHGERGFEPIPPKRPFWQFFKR